MVCRASFLGLVELSICLFRERSSRQPESKLAAAQSRWQPQFGLLGPTRAGETPEPAKQRAFAGPGRAVLFENRLQPTRNLACAFFVEAVRRAFSPPRLYFRFFSWIILDNSGAAFSNPKVSLKSMFDSNAE